MAFNTDKYGIEVINYDAIKRNWPFFDFTKQTFNWLYGFYLREICILIELTMEDQMRKQSAEEIEKLNRGIKSRKKRKEVKYTLLQKNPVLWIIEPEKFEQQVAPPTQIHIRTYHIGENQAVAKMKILEYVSVGKEVELIL